MKVANTGYPQGIPINTEVYQILLSIVFAYTKEILRKRNHSIPEIYVLLNGDDILLFGSIKLVFQEYKTLKDDILPQLGWEFSKKKCKMITYQNNLNIRPLQKSNEFDYNGYNYMVDQDKITISITKERIKRLKLNILESFLKIFYRLWSDNPINTKIMITSFLNFKKDLDLLFDLGIKKSQKKEIIEWLIKSVNSLCNLLNITKIDASRINLDEIQKDQIIQYFEKFVSELKTIPLFTNTSSYNPDIILTTDGAAEYCPFHAGGGAVIEFKDQKIEKKWYFGRKDNNEAEFGALFHALNFIRNQFSENYKILAYSDSLSLITSIYQDSKIRSKKLIPLDKNIKNLTKKFKGFKINHIQGPDNIADRLSKEAIEEGRNGKLEYSPLESDKFEL